jgi:uncharacterized protein YecE (DUF72 family)
MAALKIGTCSWKYPSWHTLVYSTPKPSNYLEEYARRYSTVEIDQWFWSLFGDAKPKLPDEKVTREYRQAVGDDFRFSIKAPNSLTLTHHYNRSKPSPLLPNSNFLSPELWNEFIATLAPLHDVLGPLILQFEYLNQDKMRSQMLFLQQLGSFLEAIPRTHAIAVEIRNPRYLNAAYFDFLAQHDLIPVLLQGYWMPSIVELYKQWKTKLQSCDTVVVRLHGGDRKGIEERTQKRWNKRVDLRDDELVPIVGMVEELASSGTMVYLNVNNHYEGSAPLTINRITELRQ